MSVSSVNKKVVITKERESICGGAIIFYYATMYLLVALLDTSYVPIDINNFLGFYIYIYIYI